MGNNGRVLVEIHDYYGPTTTGSPHNTSRISSLKIEGYRQSYDDKVRVRVAHNKLENVFSVPVLIKGLGPSLIYPSGFDSGYSSILNPGLTVLQSSNNTTRNNDWISGSQSGLISSTNQQPASGTESAIILPLIGSDNYITIYDSGTTGLFSPLRRSRIDIIHISGDSYQDPLVGLTGSSLTNSAWISYDMSTGINPKNVYAYSVTLLLQVSGTSGFNFYRGDTGDYKVFQYQNGVRLYSGFCEQINDSLNSTGFACPLENELGNSEDDGDGAAKICLAGPFNTGEIASLISGALAAQLELEEYQKALSNNPTISEDGLGTQAFIWTGVITYNNPFSGDSITFSPYNFDYTGFYSGTYHAAPPYPKKDFTWIFGVDFTGIDSLVQTINNHLYSSGYFLWLSEFERDSCKNETRSSGYYESGRLALATKINSNEILIEPQFYRGDGKYKWTIQEVTRPNKLKGDPLNILRFLHPSRVRLQAGDIYNNWTTINTQNGIDWLSITPKVEIRPDYLSLSGLLNSYQNSSIKPDPVFGAEGQPEPNLVYTTTITGINACGLLFNQKFEFYENSKGVNSLLGTQGCFFDGNENLDDLYNPDAYTTGEFVAYFLLKTGWRFTNPTGYNYYRIAMDDFYSSDRGLNIKLLNEFRFENVNFYTYTSGLEVHTGDACLLGATYTGKIQGITTGLISGYVSGVASIATSGQVVFYKYLVTGLPEGFPIVKMNRQSGTVISPFSGLVFLTLTGTGFFQESVCGVFYESGITGLTFKRPVSGIIRGSGNLTGGPYIIVRDSWITETGIQVPVVGVFTGLHSGVIYNYAYSLAGKTGFTYISGSLTGTTNTGYYQFNQSISLSPTTAYSLLLSGTKPATGVLIFNNPQIDDQVIINGFPLYYNTGSGFLSPTFYSGIQNLTDIINSGTDTFLVTGHNDGAKIYLHSINPGTSGNGITLTTTGSIGCPTFLNSTMLSGEDYYYSMSPTGNYTGIISAIIGATGIYTGTVSGYLTGTLKNFLFLRYFTGIWNLFTGDSDFRENGWISGAGLYTSSGFAPLYNFSGVAHALHLGVTYRNEPIVNTPDLARLKIYGTDFDQTLEIILSGRFSI